MRVFWHNGALMIEPEGEREVGLLTELAGNLKFGRPSGMQDRIPSGETPSGSDGLFKGVVADHEGGPSGLTRKRHNKQHIVAINERP
jgi:hypothetical protein